MESKKLYWIFIVGTFIVLAFAGYNLYQSQKILDEAKTIKNNTERIFEEQQFSCYLRLSTGQCISLNEIGFIKKSSTDAVCVQLNCMNATEYKRGIMMLIIEGNLQNKKVILMDDPEGFKLR